MYHSSACWKTLEEVNRIFQKIVSTTQKLEAIKDQIKMRVIGLGWKDLHHPWSKDGKHYTALQLKKYLINTIIPEESRRHIPLEAPAAALHSRSSIIQLGTRAHDIIELDRKANNICKTVKDKGLKEFERLDIEKNLQPFDILEVTTSLIDTKIEMLWELKEHDNTMKLCWCSGTVIALKHNDKVIVE